MPSLEQLHHEALADAVGRSRHSVPFTILSTIFGIDPQPLDARVALADGRTIELRVTDVALDGGELVGKRRNGRVVTIPLSDVKAVWHRRQHWSRTAIVSGTVWLAVSAVAAGGFSTPLAVAVALGALASTTVGTLLIILLNQFNVLSKWPSLYDRDGEAPRR